MTNILAAKREQLFAAIAEEDADPSLAALRDLARKHTLYVHVGSLAIKLSPERAANRSFLIDPKGEIVARYDKIHMFDVDLANGESYRESNSYRPGESAALAELPWGVLGLTVCYDMRFPALYRALAEAGATMLAAPSAFTQQTGEAGHWNVLLRARAIENGSFVFAAAQGGSHESGRLSLRPFADRRSVGPRAGGRRRRAGRRDGRDRSGRGRQGARAHSLAAARAALRDGRADGRADPSACGAGRRMIRYSLVCDKGHEFESWFANSAAYDKQAKRKLVSCPACGSTKVEKALMTPRLASSKKRRAWRPCRRRRRRPRRRRGSARAARSR